MRMSLYGLRQANLVLITYAMSKGSDEPAHPRSLARTFAARSYKQGIKRNLQTEDRSLAPLNGWACAVKICHEGMLEDTNSHDGAHIIIFFSNPLPFQVVVYWDGRWSQALILNQKYQTIFAP